MNFTILECHPDPLATKPVYTGIQDKRLMRAATYTWRMRTDALLDNLGAGVQIIEVGLYLKQVLHYGSFPINLQQIWQYYYCEISSVTLRIVWTHHKGCWHSMVCPQDRLSTLHCQSGMEAHHRSFLCSVCLYYYANSVHLARQTKFSVYRPDHKVFRFCMRVGGNYSTSGMSYNIISMVSPTIV